MTSCRSQPWCTRPLALARPSACTCVACVFFLCCRPRSLAITYNVARRRVLTCRKLSLPAGGPTQDADSPSFVSGDVYNVELVMSMPQTEPTAPLLCTRTFSVFSSAAGHDLFCCRSHWALLCTSFRSLAIAVSSLCWRRYARATQLVRQNCVVNAVCTWSKVRMSTAAKTLRWVDMSDDDTLEVAFAILLIVLYYSLPFPVTGLPVELAEFLLQLYPSLLQTNSLHAGSSLNAMHLRRYTFWGVWCDCSFFHVCQTRAGGVRRHWFAASGADESGGYVFLLLSQRHVRLYCSMPILSSDVGRSCLRGRGLAHDLRAYPRRLADPRLRVGKNAGSCVEPALA